MRAQVKSRWYYPGEPTVAVVAGQIYVGTSYRAMAKSMNRWFDTFIPRGRSMIPPPTGDFGRDQIDLTELDPDDYIIWLEVDEEV